MRDALMELLNAQTVERLFVPPLMLQGLAEHFNATGASAPSLRDVIVAGEQLRVSPEIVGFFGVSADAGCTTTTARRKRHVVTSDPWQVDPDEWPRSPRSASQSPTVRFNP